MKSAKLKDFSTIKDLTEPQAVALADIQRKIVSYTLSYHALKISYDEYMALIEELLDLNKIEKLCEESSDNINLKKEFELLKKLAYKVLIT